MSYIRHHLSDILLVRLNYQPVLESNFLLHMPRLFLQIVSVLLLGTKSDTYSHTSRRTFAINRQHILLYLFRSGRRVSGLLFRNTM